MICKAKGNIKVCVEGSEVRIINVATKEKRICKVPSEVARALGKVDFYYFLLLILMWCDY